jgi:hypothetical protein
MATSESLRKVGAALSVLGIVNFIVYGFVSMLLGGDAVSGHAEGGIFFLGSHGKLTETTAGIFLYSRIHTYSLWITHPLGFIGAWLYRRGRK